MFKLQYQYGKKRKYEKKISGLQNRGVRGLQVGAGFKDCKSGQEELQIRAKITIRCTTTLTLKSTIYFLDRKKRIAIIN